MKINQIVTEGLRTENPCWQGYKPVGTKEKDGRTVPNCVPVNEEHEDIPDLEEVGEPVQSIMDAERRLAAGDRIFVAHEMDDEPFEIHNVGDLAGYTYDQVLAVPAQVDEAVSPAQQAAIAVNMKKAGKKPKKKVDEAGDHWAGRGFDLRSDILWPAYIVETKQPEKYNEFSGWMNKARDQQSVPQKGSVCVLAMINLLPDSINVVYGPAKYIGQTDTDYILKISSGTHKYNKKNQIVFDDKESFDKFMTLLSLKFSDSGISIDSKQMRVMEKQQGVAEALDDRGNPKPVTTGHFADKKYTDKGLPKPYPKLKNTSTGKVRHHPNDPDQGVAEAAPKITGKTDYTGLDLVKDANKLFTAGGFKLADKQVEPRQDDPKKINTIYFWRKKIPGLGVQELMIEIYNYAPNRTYYAVNDYSKDGARVTPDLAQKMWREMEFQIKDMSSQFGLAEGSENLAIGQQMARDGIEYDPAQEGETISIIGDYLKRSGMTPRQVRGYMIDNDFVSDQLSYLPRKSGVSEGFNGEYDDEAGMARSNLLTSARAVIGLLKTIKDRDNLPEWTQEKIAKAEMMLVGVWNYLQSQKEQGINPQQGVTEQNWSHDPWKDKYFGPTAGALKKIFKVIVQDSESNVKAFNVKAETEQQAKEVIEKHAPGTTVKSIKFVKNLMAEQEVDEGKTGPGLWANIHAKRERIKSGSGERMRKPGSKGAPKADDFKAAATESFNLAEELQKLDDAKYHGREVALNTPMPGDVKKSKVYVKDPKTGNVKKVNFGQKGVKIKKNNPARRKSFRARHNCDNPGPKTKAKYWSCRAW